MPVHFQKRIYREDLQANPKTVFVFGDNEGRWGRGGQAAEMRGEPNAHGVATLKAPGIFWTDTEYHRQCAVLDADFAPLFVSASEGRTIVLPLDGIGTGLACLEQNAPLTFAYLQTLWNQLIQKASQ